MDQMRRKEQKGLVRTGHKHVALEEVQKRSECTSHAWQEAKDDRLHRPAYTHHRHGDRTTSLVHTIFSHYCGFHTFSLVADLLMRRVQRSSNSSYVLREP
jgi:hypothetical protein